MFHHPVFVRADCPEIATWTLHVLKKEKSHVTVRLPSGEVYTARFRPRSIEMYSHASSTRYEPHLSSLCILVDSPRRAGSLAYAPGGVEDPIEALAEALDAAIGSSAAARCEAMSLLLGHLAAKRDLQAPVWDLRHGIREFRSEAVIIPNAALDNIYFSPTEFLSGVRILATERFRRLRLLPLSRFQNLSAHKRLESLAKTYKLMSFYGVEKAPAWMSVAAEPIRTLFDIADGRTQPLAPTATLRTHVPCRSYPPTSATM